MTILRVVSTLLSIIGQVSGVIPLSVPSWLAGVSRYRTYHWTQLTGSRSGLGLLPSSVSGSSRFEEEFADAFPFL